MSVTPSSTVVGIFTDRSAAKQAVDALYTAGFTHEQIHSAIPGGLIDELKNIFTGTDADASNFAYDLTNLGLSDEEVRYYAEAYHKGNAVLAVRAQGREQEVANIFDQFGGYGTRTEPRPFDVTTNAASEVYAQSDVYGSPTEQSWETPPPAEAAPVEAQPQEVVAPEAVETAPVEAQPQEVAAPEAPGAEMEQQIAPPEELPAAEAEQTPVAYEGDSAVATSSEETAEQPVDQSDTSEATAEYQTAQDQADDAQDAAEVAPPADTITEEDQPQVSEEISVFEVAETPIATSDTVATNEVTGSNGSAPAPAEPTPAAQAAPVASSKLQALRQQLEATRQELQEVKARLQAAREQEAELQATRQELKELQAELDATHAELQETHNRLEQY